jgi:hypothetical protein
MISPYPVVGGILSLINLPAMQTLTEQACLYHIVRNVNMGDATPMPCRHKLFPKAIIKEYSDR